MSDEKILATPPKYKPEYCYDIIRLGCEGKTRCQMAAALGVSTATLRAWSVHPALPEFKEAYAMANTHGQAYMEKIGMDGLKGLLPKFQPAVWIFMMKARYRDDYGDTDTTKIEFNDTKNLSDKELEERLKAYLARRASEKNKPKEG